MKNFESIIGYDAEKEELMRLCDVLKNRNKYADLGVKMPQAILIYGEPGLGKTLMAKTLIENSGRNCYSCKKDRAGDAFVDKIRETFESAINNQPSIVFLDDVDKFAQDNLREDNNKEEFVTIQSCFDDINDKDVFVVATANEILNIPYSLLREGRFGRRIKVDAPSREDSVKIIGYFLRNKPVSKEVSAEFIADFLGGKTCAFLEEAVNEAGIYAGYEGKNEINKKHFINAVMRLTTKNLPSKKMNEKEKRIVCVHESGHAVASVISGKKVSVITFKEHGNVGGFCSFCDYEKNYTYDEFKNEIIILLAGKAATELVCNIADPGAESDIETAIKLIRRRIEKLATDGFYYLYDRNEYDHNQPVRRIENIEDKISETLEKLYAETISMIRNHEDLLTVVAFALSEKEVLVWDDICDIVNGMPDKNNTNPAKTPIFPCF